MKTPTTVTAAFLPETEYILDVEGTLILEALDCAWITGSRPPGFRDTLLAHLAMTDLAALKRARQSGTVDALLAQRGRGQPPREVMAQLPAIAAAIKAATDPAATPEPTGDDDSPEKKDSPDADGG